MIGSPQLKWSFDCENKQRFTGHQTVLFIGLVYADQCLCGAGGLATAKGSAARNANASRVFSHDAGVCGNDFCGFVAVVASQPEDFR